MISRRVWAFASILFAVSAWSQAPVAKGWSSVGVSGAVLLLESQTEVEELRFIGEPSGGWVAVTLGKKGGPMTAPVFPWRLEGGVIHIRLESGEETLSLLKLEDGLAHVRRNSGVVLRYKLVKQ